MEELTFGQKAVGLKFNPSGSDAVANCKQGFADLIDVQNDLRNNTTDREVIRLASIAITELQGAQMWAVKASPGNPNPAYEQLRGAVLVPVTKEVIIKEA